MQQRNLLVFFLIITSLMFVYITVRPRLFPPAPVARDKDKEKDKDKAKEKSAARPGATPPADAPVFLPLPPAATPTARLHTLGSDDPESPFDLQVVLDPLGGGVRSVTLNKFKAADPFSGRPVRGETLQLVPDEVNRIEPSHLLFHYDPRDPKGDRPVDTLGRRVWTVVEQDGQAVVGDEVEGKQRQRVAFRSRIDDVTVTKTFSLVEGEYHIGLQIDLERAAGKDDAPTKFRYQLTGAKGLPVEGKWYTGTFRNALIALEDGRGNIDRKFQDLRQIGLWAGGNKIERDEGRFIRYAGVAVQYFASVLVADERQNGAQKAPALLSHARPTLETAVARGRIKGGIDGPIDRLVLRSDDGKTEQTIYLPPHLQGAFPAVRDGQMVAAIYRSLSYDDRLKEAPKVALDLRFGVDAEGTHALWEDDITVRVAAEPVNLAPGKRVSHRYLLYNGPVKPSLLGQLGGKRQVEQALIDRYVETLKLNTLTDYPSPGGLSAFSSFIGWTYLIIKCTNLMHWVLGKMTLLIPSYGLSILLLTLLVRLMMFPLSRKQAIMGLKMQMLQPELKKLADKHKDDRQAYAQAQMALFREHGVNPFGSCWILILQMPIFMGLYFALQESIQFRLAPFWPTWITNLAAPDMMFEWGRWIPLLSRDADYGGMLYLGPYFNLLPIITVALMVVQQKMMTPPPADKEQEMQQKMMRIMMIVFGLFFYRLAAGLCLYIIVSTLWGFAERKLLPKAKAPKLEVNLDRQVALLATGGAAAATVPGSTAVTAPGPVVAGKKGGKNRRKDRGKPGGKAEDEPQTRFGQLRQRLRDWWNDVLEQARKK